MELEWCSLDRGHRDLLGVMSLDTGVLNGANPFRKNSNPDIRYPTLLISMIAAAYCTERINELLT